MPCKLLFAKKLLATIKTLIFLVTGQFFCQYFRCECMKNMGKVVEKADFAEWCSDVLKVK